MSKVFPYQDVKALRVLEKLISIGLEMIVRRSEVTRLNILKDPKPVTYRHDVHEFACAVSASEQLACPKTGP